MPQRFVGKVALVTGAGCVGPGWGNGRAIAVALAREGHRDGAPVAPAGPHAPGAGDQGDLAGETL